MKTLVMNDDHPCFCRALAERGYRIIPTENIKTFHPPERRHADLQVLPILNRVFTLKDCPTIGRNYPDNVRLNALYFRNKLYGHLQAVEPSVLAFCRENGVECVHVNQGYTRCSALVIGDNAVITADKSIEKALKKDGAEVLLIAPDHIRLEGFDYGFIGGAGFADEGAVYFFGDITKHPDHQAIRAFCEKNHSTIEILCGEEPLTDLGGAVTLSSSG